MEALENKGKIELSFHKDQEGVYIQIKDNGPGISSPDQEKIFDPFFTKKDDGTGLGLSVSRKIAESYGGSLRLMKDESGACFELFLPIDPSDGFKEKLRPENESSLTNKRI